jgi:hypothetical protein
MSCLGVAQCRSSEDRDDHLVRVDFQTWSRSRKGQGFGLDGRQGKFPSISKACDDDATARRCRVVVFAADPQSYCDVAARVSQHFSQPGRRPNWFIRRW